jgi:hypothetical protein
MSTGAPTDGRTEQRFPWQVGLATLAWVVLGVTAIVTAMGGRSRTPDADAGSVGQLQDSLGDSAAATHETGPSPAILVAIGLAVLLFAGLLALGQGWARWALTAVGVGTVIFFAAAVGWVPAMIAMGALIVGSLPLLSRSATRYLEG